MAGSSLAKKMKLKPGLRATVINQPDGYMAELSPPPPGVQMSTRLAGRFDWIQIFVKDQAALKQLAPRAIKALTPGGHLWISFPKGSSKIQTDLSGDQGWDSIRQADLKWVTLISVNATWSAFGVRTYKPGEKR